MKLLFVQFGDYREAYHRFAQGGQETYYAQKFTVDWVSEQAKEMEYVGVCCIDSESYAELLPNQVHTYGMKCLRDGPNDLIALLNKISPTHLVCSTPYRPLIEWGARSSARVLPLLADSFNERGLKSWLRYFLLKRLLNRFEWIANHNLNASFSLKAIGVLPQKIIPWDYPSFISPNDYPAKTIKEPLRDIKLVYIGNLIESKGVNDAIVATKLLMDKGFHVELTLAGPSNSESFAKKSKDLGIEGSVVILGRVPHTKAFELMRTSDVVLVPSWHQYPEGLPLTIYESFCSRTPLIASDHPMFKGKVVHKKSGLMFKAQDTHDLAEKIQELTQNPSLYNELSNNTINAWQHLQIHTKWDELIKRWIRYQEEDKVWLSERTLVHYPLANHK